MKMVRTSFKKYKSFYIFLSILFLFGLATGILFYFKQEPSLQETILASLQNLFHDNVFSFQNILYHLIFFLLLCALLFCFLGLPFLIVYLFFEGISIGFIFPIFLSLFKINSFLYFFVYFLFIKFIYLFLLFSLFIKCFHFTKNYIYCLKNKNYGFMKDIKYILIFILFLFLNDLFVYFVSNKLLIFLLG